jgi:uncharacterized membrane protein
MFNWAISQCRKVQRSIYPAELLVLFFAVLAFVLYAGLGLSLRDPVRLYFAKVSLGFASYVIGLLLALCLSRLRDIKRALAKRVKKSQRATFEDFKSRYFPAGRLAHDLRLIHAISVMFVVYINLKHLIPYINSTLYDGPLMALELALFGGKSPSELVFESIGNSWAAVLSEAYTAFFPYIAMLTVWMVLQNTRAYAQQFTFAFCLMWFLAVFVEYAIPTWGPCFYVPDLFSHLPFTRVTELQQELWEQKLYLDMHPRSEKGVWLISGLPSLHVAAVMLGSIYLGITSKVMANFSWLFFGITCVTTLYFGWHYLADIPAAVALVLLVQFLSLNLFKRLEHRQDWR